MSNEINALYLGQVLLTHFVLTEATYVMLCTIWYYSYILKNLKNIHGGVLLLVKLQALVTFTEEILNGKLDFLFSVNSRVMTVMYSKLTIKRLH